MNGKYVGWSMYYGSNGTNYHIIKLQSWSHICFILYVGVKQSYNYLLVKWQALCLLTTVKCKIFHVQILGILLSKYYDLGFTIPNLTYWIYSINEAKITHLTLNSLFSIPSAFSLCLSPFRILSLFPSTKLSVVIKLKFDYYRTSTVAEASRRFRCFVIRRCYLFSCNGKEVFSDLWGKVAAFVFCISWGLYHCFESVCATADSCDRTRLYLNAMPLINTRFQTLHSINISNTESTHPISPVSFISLPGIIFFRY